MLIACLPPLSLTGCLGQGDDVVLVCVIGLLLLTHVSCPTRVRADVSCSYKKRGGKPKKM